MNEKPIGMANGNGGGGGGDASGVTQQQQEPQQELQCYEKLPPEIWRVILNRLHDIDYSQMWNCRLVCKGMKVVTDVVLKENVTLWQPTYYYWCDYVKDMKGTRLSTVAEAQRFIDEMGGYEGNPFPNGTVILTSNEYWFNEDFRASLHNFVSNFRESIQSLVYSFYATTTEDFVDEFLQIVNICNLPSLKSLAIIKGWSMLPDNSVQLLTRLSSLLKGPSSLKELIIFGGGSCIPALYVFPAFENIVKSLDKLKMNMGGCNTTAQSLAELGQKHQMPNYSLSCLEVVYPSEGISHESLLANYNDENAYVVTRRSLKELIFRVTFAYRFSESKGMGRIISQDLLGLLDASTARDSLELLTIEISEACFTYSTQEQLQLAPPINVDVRYPKVSHLTIRFLVIRRWEAMTEELFQKLPNLKKLTLIGTKADFSEDDWTPKDLHNYVYNDIWGKFPLIETVHVPYFGWILKGNRTGLKF